MSPITNLNARYYYNNGYGYRRRWTGGRIAGVVIGIVAFMFLICAFSLCMRRRRRARFAAVSQHHQTPAMSGARPGGMFSFGNFGHANRTNAPPNGSMPPPPYNGNGKEGQTHHAPPPQDQHYAPPQGPPPTSGEHYAPPPGPPPAAHVADHQGNQPGFVGGFRT